MSQAPFNLAKFATQVGKSNLLRYCELSKSPTLDALLNNFLDDNTLSAQSLPEASHFISVSSNGFTEDNLTDFHQIATLFTSKGRNAIHIACKGSACKHLLTMDLSNEGLGMQLFLENREIFKQALMLHDINDAENWKLFKASNISGIKANTVVATTTFKNKVYEYLQSLNLPGTIKITPFITKGRIVLEAYYAKNLENQWHFSDNDQMECIPLRKPLQINLDYDCCSGHLKIKTPNTSSAFEVAIKDIFAQCFLTKPKGLLCPDTNPIIQLLPLVQSSLRTDPSDGVSEVQITGLKFFPPDDKRENISIGYSDSGILERLRQKGIVPEQQEYYFAKVRFFFSDKRYGRSRTIHLNAKNNRINWTGDLRDQIIEKYLKRWGVLHD